MRDRGRSAVAAELATLSARPLISVVMPVYDVDPSHLRAAIGSVRAQHYPDWELVIVDDCSTRADTRKAVKRAVSRDPRITARLLTLLLVEGASATTGPRFSMTRARTRHPGSLTPIRSGVLPRLHRFKDMGMGRGLC